MLLHTVLPCRQRMYSKVTSHPATGPSVTRAVVHELHWLPVKCRIQFNIAVFMHQVTAQRCPSHVADLVAFCLSDSQGRPLRSTSTRAAIIQRSTADFGRHAFAFCGPDVWNSLPPSLRTVTSHSAFRRALKTHFYNLAFFLDFILLPLY